MSLKYFCEPDRLKKPQAIFCDIDDTLYPYEPSHRQAMAAVEEKLMDLVGVAKTDLREVLKTAKKEVKARLGLTASSHSRLLYFQRTLELMEIRPQCLMAMDLEQTYWRTFLNESILFPGVAEFFSEAHLSGIPIVIVTDLTAKIQFRKLIYFGLDKHVDYIVTSEESGEDKPAAASFKLAQQKVGIEDCSSCWMVGESAGKDILGAKQHLGCVTLQKLHEGVEVGQGDCCPDASFTDFDDLRVFYADQE